MSLMSYWVRQELVELTYSPRYIVITPNEYKPIVLKTVI